MSGQSRWTLLPAPVKVSGLHKRSLAAPPALCQQQKQHVEDDGKITQKYHRTNYRDATHEPADLDGEKQRSGKHGNPLGPGALLPQAVDLDKSQKRIGERQASGGEEAGVGEAVGEIQKKLRPVAVGADVQEREQALGNHPFIFVNQHERAQANEEHKSALEEFVESNQPQQICLGAGRVDFRSQREHAARKAGSDYHGGLCLPPVLCACSGSPTALRP
jgi:hypothetical protein